MAALVLLLLAIYIISNKYTRQLIFVHKGSHILKLLFGYILVVPFLYKNWIGLLVGIGMTLAIVLGLYMRSIMTRELYERVLNYICILSLTSTGYALFEKLINVFLDARHSHRISAVFLHPNYFGTIAGTVMIICAYKILTNQGSKGFYIAVAFANAISIYLSMSMFAWVEVFLGVSVLLVSYKRYKLFLLWVTSAALGAAAIFGLNLDLLPRLSDADTTINLRQHIWALTISQIKASPLFGHGFMSFLYLYHATFRGDPIPHSHSIYLDSLLNLGIAGTLLFLWYIGRYYIPLIRIRLQEKNIMITSLILAVSVAALAHGTTDITLQGLQTFPLFIIILSGLGADEKNGRYLINTDCFF